MRPATVLLILSSWHNYAQREVPCYTAAEYGGGGCFCFCVFVFVFINNIVLSQCAYDYVSCIELKEHNYVINTSNRCVKGGKGREREREREREHGTVIITSNRRVKSVCP